MSVRHILMYMSKAYLKSAVSIPMTGKNQVKKLYMIFAFSFWHIKSKQP